MFAHVRYCTSFIAIFPIRYLHSSYCSQSTAHFAVSAIISVPQKESKALNFLQQATTHDKSHQWIFERVRHSQWFAQRASSFNLTHWRHANANYFPASCTQGNGMEISENHLHTSMFQHIMSYGISLKNWKRHSTCSTVLYNIGYEIGSHCHFKFEWKIYLFSSISLVGTGKRYSKKINMVWLNVDKIEICK